MNDPRSETSRALARWRRGSVLGSLSVLSAALVVTGCEGGNDTPSPAVTDGGTDSTADGTPGVDGGRDAGAIDSGSDTGVVDSGHDAGTDLGATETGGDATTGETGTASAPPGTAQVILAPGAIDATPDPTGTKVYFTAIAPDSTGVPQAGIYELATAMPTTINTVFVNTAANEALTSPFGIVVSLDGATLFVADVGAETASGDLGAIFSVPAAGGTPTLVANTDGLQPRSLAIAGTSLYFTGTEANGTPAVFSMPIAGGSPTVVLAGAAGVDDYSGIAAAPSGNLYVVDTTSSGSRSAQVIEIASGATAATVLTGYVSVGYPAGIGVAQDESFVLVSGNKASDGSDVLWSVPTTAGTVTPITTFGSTSVAAFTEAAGLHHITGPIDVYAWVDSLANGGSIFVLSK